MRRTDTSVIEREVRRRKSSLIMKSVIAVLILAAAGLGAMLVHELFFKDYKNPWSPQSSVSGQKGSNASGGGSQGSQAGSVTGEESGNDTNEESLEAQANLLASQYDYDGAVELLKASDGYEHSERRKSLVQTYMETKESCQPAAIDQITHVFFHSLIADDARAFDGDEKTDGYNQVMTTITEFNSIIEQMYNRGYVMVSLHDMVQVAADGSVTAKEIRLPAGKIPFVLSQDDCSYYHYMDGDGFASKLLIDENGKVKNQYTQADGQTVIGDYDVVPLIDSFVEKHPDFAYHGHKGILALTGYEGVLGYRTDEVYKTREPDRMTVFQTKFFEQHPDFNFDQETADAKKVADAMKAEGWEFASHTWGHINPKQHSLDEVRTDTERWKNWVAPIVGDTDVLIFAFGADIGDWRPYTTDNEYFTYYQSMGFHIFCNVDASTKAWVQIGSTFMRQGRRNLDGYRMYYTPDLISDLFDVKKAWDPNRPTPVPKM